jgi:hypothetical protein
VISWNLENGAVRLASDLPPNNEVTTHIENIFRLELITIAGLEEIFDGFRSTTPDLRTVVLGQSVVNQFPQLRRLSGMEERFLIDDGSDTIVKLVERGVSSVEYYGGQEEGSRFAAIAQSAQITTRSHQPGSVEFLDQLREILAIAGVPDAVIAAGAEEFAQQLQATAVAA